MSQDPTYSQCYNRTVALLRTNVNYAFSSLHLNWTRTITGFSSANVLYDAYPRFVFESSNFTQTCGSAGAVFPDKETAGVATDSKAAVVFNVTTFDASIDANSTAPTVLRIGSCDGSVAYNVTKPGVYVVKGAYAFGVLERKDGGGTNCSVGDARVAYQVAPLADYCSKDPKLVECPASTAPPAPPKSVARKHTLAAVVMTGCGALAAALI